MSVNRIKSIEDLITLKKSILEKIDPNRLCITLCGGTGCNAHGSEKVHTAFKEEIRRQGMEDCVDVKRTGCHGFCEKGPIVVIKPDEIFYQKITLDDIPEIISETLRKNKIIDRLPYIDPLTGDKIIYNNDVVFYKKQERVVLRNNGKIDPTDILDYIANDGYLALNKALTSMTPEQIIEEVKKSGLRGRGGAGFPTGRKWEICKGMHGDVKYIVCNADEGDPGAYMDRSVLEGDPHSVIEGMMIGAYAIGANEGYVYVRTEYPLAIINLNIAIQQAEDYGLLGDNIFDSGFNFRIRICQGSGAFVCGEETALIASIEGRAPEPRQRPPFPAQSGLWGKPTNINNVETWTNIPVIIDRGAEWFSMIGTEKSKGTKIFSLVGKVNNTGLVEVPMGMSLKEIIYDIGGGIPAGRRFKAVQTGGPSGGCIPSDLIDLPVDYERLTEAGSMMGSGGMVVMDDRTCVVDIAKFFLRFTNDESCGKCTSCRDGSEALLEILSRISNGEGKIEDLELLEDLAVAIKNASLCGLGQTLPNPVLSTLRYYREEYEAHIKYKRCPAIVCKGIISSPCHHACPLGQDISCYIGLIVLREYDKALEVIKAVNPLPSTCGRVCHFPCEGHCNLYETGESMSIKALKRFVGDLELKKGRKLEKPEKIYDENVAIIGSGPAGLTCAYFLKRYGYPVTIFEKYPVSGGMLAVGIPDYRLPKNILNIEIESLREMGIETRTNIAIGEDIQLSDLKKDGYKAIFIATGAHKGLKMNIPGEDFEGVIDGVDIIRDVNLGKKVNLGEKVLVIGGGNAALDAARVVKRMGRDVKLLYRRTRAEMPAQKNEIIEALHEGIEMQFLVAPIRIFSENGKVSSIECIRMRLGDVDKSGRRRPVPIEGSNFILPVDTLIAAVGQEPELGFIKEIPGIKISKWNTIEVDPGTLYTGVDGIFAGGDVVTGPSTVSEAMGHGKSAAFFIHKYLRGESLIREYSITKPMLHVEPIELSEEELEKLKRPQMPCQPPSIRITNFEEVDLGYAEETAVLEAKRCLRCDLKREKGI